MHRKEAGQRLLQTLTSLVPDSNMDKHPERWSPRNIVHRWIKDLRAAKLRELGRENKVNGKLRNAHQIF